MSKRAVIALALMAAALGAWMAFSYGAPARDDMARTSPGVSGAGQLDLLEGLDPADTSARFALMLHPPATGNGHRVILDQTVLLAAQPAAIELDKARRVKAASPLFGPFPGPADTRSDTGLATLIRNKQMVDHFTCDPAECSLSADTTFGQLPNLADLIAASHPVELVTDIFQHHDKARAAHFRALKNDRIVLIQPPKLPAPNTIVFTDRLRLRLPAVLLDTDDSGTSPLVAL